MDHIPRSPSNLSEELQDETRDSVPLSQEFQGSDAEILQEHSDPTSTSLKSSAQEETNSRNHEQEPVENIEAPSENDAADKNKEVDHIVSMVTQEEALQPPGTERPVQEN